MKSKILSITLWLFAVFGPVSAWAGACTLSVSSSRATAAGITPALSPLNIVSGSESFVLGITCPSGQPWTLYSPGDNECGANYNCATSGAFVIWDSVCGYGKTTCSPTADYAVSNAIYASGTGTGSPQIVTARHTARLAASDYIYHSTPFVLYALGKQAYAGTFGASTTIGSTAAGWRLNSTGADYWSTYSVTLDIAPACALITSSSTLGFTGAADATSFFIPQYLCSYGFDIPFSMSIGSGNNPTGEVRRASRSGQYLAYHLYWDSGQTQDIDVTAHNTWFFTPINATAYGAKTIYCRIKTNDALSTPAATIGTYTDTVAVTITY
jgi:spore coat protein U-like protein